MTAMPRSADQVIADSIALLQQGRPEDALRDLQDASRLYAGDARLSFLLGSVLAGQGQYEQAMAQMAQAARLEPGFAIAHFQLGSLRMTSGDGPGAKQAWQALEPLPDAHPLKCFKTGCEALIDDSFESAVQWLRRGIAANTDNPPLNHDMQLLVERTEALIAAQAAPVEGGANHLLIHGYQTQMDGAPEPGAAGVDPGTRH